MNNASYCRVAGAVFFLAGLLHLFRLIYHWDVMWNGHTAPFWLSWVAVFVLFYLAVVGLTRR